MAKRRHFITLLGILVALLLIYVFLAARAAKREAAESEEEAGIAITAIEDITSFTYNFGNGEVTMTKEDGAWTVAGKEDFTLDETYPESMSTALGALTAERELTSIDSLADYGLEEPAYTVSVTDADGNVTEIFIGNATGENYYVTLDKETVYTVAADTFTDFFTEVDEMAAESKEDAEGSESTE